MRQFELDMPVTAPHAEIEQQIEGGLSAERAVDVQMQQIIGVADQHKP